MRSRSLAAQHDAAVARRLELLTTELAAVRERGADPGHPGPSGGSWSPPGHTHIRAVPDLDDESDGRRRARPVPSARRRCRRRSACPAATPHAVRRGVVAGRARRASAAGSPSAPGSSRWWRCSPWSAWPSPAGGWSAAPVTRWWRPTRPDDAAGALATPDGVGPATPRRRAVAPPPESGEGRGRRGRQGAPSRHRRPAPGRPGRRRAAGRRRRPSRGRPRRAQPRSRADRRGAGRGRSGRRVRDRCASGARGRLTGRRSGQHQHRRRDGAGVAARGRPGHGAGDHHLAQPSTAASRRSTSCSTSTASATPPWPSSRPT